MTTLAIPPHRVQLYRALWDRWIIVLRILFDLGAGAHPVKWRAVADTLLVDKKTCQKYIQGLVREGRIVTASDGYMLTQAGMNALLENEEGEFLPLEGKNLGENFSPLKESVVVNDSELKQLTPPPPESGKIPGENFSPLAQLIFHHIPDLFAGSTLVLTGLLPWANDEILLGWVAYAFDKRTSLLSPVGLMYSKLKKEERPPMEYARNYAQYLPLEFLRAIGLEVSEPEPIVEELVEPPAPQELSVAEQLVLDMQERSPEISAVVHTWIPLTFEHGVLRIAVNSEERRERWQRRIGDLAGRLLSEITGTPAQVKFIVSVETEVE